MTFETSRSPSRWSTSISLGTKSTGSTNKTIPLTNVRKQLFRQSTNTQKTLPHRMAKSKHDIEELFRLYYSNDVKFDAFQRQIVTGTKISTDRTSSQVENPLTTSSSNVFHSKHCVSREEWNSLDTNHIEQHPMNHEPTKPSLRKRTVQFRINDDSMKSPRASSLNSNISFPIRSSLISTSSEKSSSNQQDNLSDSPINKNLTLLGNISNTYENSNIKKTKSNLIQRSFSSKPSFSEFQNLNRKDPIISSTTSFSTLNSSQQNQPAIVTGSAVVARQRSPTRQYLNKQRTKSNASISRTLSSPPSTMKTRSPSMCSPVSIQTDAPEIPVFVGAQRVVSIPSKCSRYVLVTFPEVPLRYNAPTYVERLLLPERFPTLFHNIVQSYDQHLTNNFQQDRHAK